MSKTISVIAREYLDMREHRQKRTANTIRADRCALNTLLAACGDIQPRNITQRHVDTLVTMISAGSIATYNARLTQIRNFLKFCRGRKYVPADFDPLAELAYGRAVQQERNRVPVTQFNALLDACTHPRDRAVVALGLFTMLRASEIVSLKISDLRLDQYELDVVIHKTKETDTMPISLELDRELRRWLTFYTEQQGGTCECYSTHPSRPLCPSWYLVPAKETVALGSGYDRTYVEEDGTGRLKPTCPMTQVQRVVQRPLRRLGYDIKQEGVHTLRRSAARALFDQRVSDGYDGALRLVQSMLHHRNSVMTERYIGLREDRHRRDKEFRAQAMLPSLQVAEVIELRPAKEV